MMLECSGAETEGTVAEWQWDAFVTPGGGTTFTPDDAPETRVVVALSGESQIGVTATDEDEVSCTAFGNIVSLSDSDTCIELTWNTPGERDQNDGVGADLDLHFLHPSGCWLDPKWDVYFRNPEPEWGDPNTDEDDPQLTLDDTTGAAPKNATPRSPESLS